MSEPIIRRATQDDFPHIVRMIRELAAHIGKGFVPKVSLEILESDGPFGRDRFRIFVAAFNEQVIGFCLYTFAFSGWRGKTGLFIEDLYIDPAARGSSLGKKLMNAALEAEAKDGISYIKLEVSTSDQAAIAFYRKSGFTLSDTEAIMFFDRAEA